MKVFNVCCLIVRRRYVSLLLYFCIFLALSVVLTVLYSETAYIGFTEIRPKFTVINRDNDSPLVDGLIEYLRERGDEIPLEDRRDILQDATFYQATNIIIIIPHGFHGSLYSGHPLKIEMVKTTQTALGYHVEGMVNQYLNMMRTYIATHPETAETTLVAKTIDDLSARVDVESIQFGVAGPTSNLFLAFVRTAAYILMVLILLCVSNISLAFRRPDLKMRNLCAPLSHKSLGIQQTLCYCLISLLAWVFITVVGFVMYGSRLSGTDARIIVLIVINMGAFTLFTTSLSPIISAVVSGPNSQNTIANVLALGLSFIGGVFVPLELLGDSMLAFSRFTPTYWYITAIDRISALTSFSRESMAGVWQAMLLQLAFAAAIFCVGLTVSKHVNASEKRLIDPSTELDA